MLYQTHKIYDVPICDLMVGRTQSNLYTCMDLKTAEESVEFYFLNYSSKGY